MKNILKLSLFLFLLAAFVFGIPVAAKRKSADQITIAGGELEEPLEISDQEILDKFNPWAGQFIGTGGPLESPPYVGDRVPYEVYFYLRDARGELQLSYMFYYYPDPAGGRGMIYLPGSKEPYYSVNAGTILRGESDGRWHHAMPTWDETVQAVVLEQANISPVTFPDLPPAVWVSWGLNLVLIVGVVILARRQILWNAVLE